jgi:signal transduction histidine kinase
MARLLGVFRDPRRPRGLAVVFWLDFALVVMHYFIVEPIPRAPGWLFWLNMAVVLGLWLLLPWDASARPARRLAALAYVPATIALGLTGSAGAHSTLILTGVAAVALVYGIRVAAAAVLVLVVGLAALWPLLPPPFDPFGFGQDLALFVISAVFVMGIVSATLEARRRREESERLLQRVRELTVAEERARIARDMHDSIGHHLTVIKMGLENAKRFRERRPEAAWDEVEQSRQLTVQALTETRRWVRALRPLDLEGQVGSAALERLASSFDGSGVEVDFAVEGAERTLDPDTELVFYRVLQEGLTNVLRHAHAAHVRVRLTFEPAQVTLVIGDDGKGADSEPGFGLTSLTERMRELGGRLLAGNTDGGGFELRAELPAAGT